MDFLKALFEAGAITWEQFSAACTEKGFKLADLATGNYVAKKKFDDEVAGKDAMIEALQGQIKTRDADIVTLRKSLEDGSKDNETKIADLTQQLTTLQGDYKTQKNDYETKLNKQAYEFAVKEFVGGLEFTSGAAKRDFTSQLLSAGLKMEGGSIMGATDFVEKYKGENADAFVVKAEPQPAPQQQEGPKPFFVQPTQPQQQQNENPFDSMFNFAGVRAH